MLRSLKLLLLKLILSISASRLLNISSRMRLLWLLGLNEKTARVQPNVYFGNPDLTTLHLGRNVFINTGCHIDNAAPIHIGDGTALAPKVTLLTGSHITRTETSPSEHRYRSITIGNNVVIFANSTILPGVTIGDGCIIAAGSVVNKDCESNWMYAGVPAKKIKPLPAYPQ